MAYDYIERAYGRAFKPGQRVRFTEYEDCYGTVTRTRGDPRYVKIRFDSDKPGQRPHRCHPLSVERVD